MYVIHCFLLTPETQKHLRLYFASKLLLLALLHKHFLATRKSESLKQACEKPFPCHVSNLSHGHRNTCSAALVMWTCSQSIRSVHSDSSHTSSGVTVICNNVYFFPLMQRVKVETFVSKVNAAMKERHELEKLKATAVKIHNNYSVVEAVNEEMEKVLGRKPYFSLLYVDNFEKTINPLTSKSDEHQVSPYSNATQEDIKVMRLRKMVTN